MRRPVEGIQALWVQVKLSLKLLLRLLHLAAFEEQFSQ